MMEKKSYSALMALPDYETRFEYLKLDGVVGARTFGGDRWMNQRFYTSQEWRSFRDEVIVRDLGCDLAVEDRPIQGNIVIHHLNPLRRSDFEDGVALFDLENVIAVAPMTHKAIHYGDKSLLIADYSPRQSGDTCPWQSTRKAV